MFLQLIVEALLYYLACSIVARRREEAPGLVRVFFTVLALAFISGGVHFILGHSFWLSSAIVFVINFFILLIGLGIGFFRTIIAAIIVILLRSLMEWAFSGVGHGPNLFS
ncbi:hypothetical protein KKC97_02615 [bacterium]|nr:hypothetical protein [bacterium]MBU1636536.1 hypothetical protein [bacterium]MBU1920068.1 hypothetical protein [bacterium]RQV97905.1 MAG: hypothetical protein EH220_04155 [bacterium]